MTYLQNQIIVHSYLYYMKDSSIIKDSEYDNISQTLAEMKEAFPESYKKTRFYYAMKNFDGSTGYDIWYNLTEEDREYISQKANLILSYKKKG